MPSHDHAVPTKEAFVALLEPLVERLRSVEVDAANAGESCEQLVPFAGDEVAAIRDAATAARDSDWLLPKENGGIRFGRVAKDLGGFSVDAVLMSGPGPKHRHPNGEIDLCFALEGEARFDGHPQGWVVYGSDSTHVPTVTDGEMLILYFLPGAAIEFLQN
ncbi:MAG: DUF4863 family protein [Planctomycetota bacterium]|nr:DUF4863 family protein [Planctomycetota bacterium]